MHPRALLLLLLIVGCSKPNPFFLGADEGTASFGGTSEATSTVAPTTSTTSTSTSTSTSEPGSTSVGLTGSGDASTTEAVSSSSTGAPLVCADAGPGMVISLVDQNAPDQDLAKVDCDAPPDEKKPYIAEQLLPNGVLLRQCVDDACVVKTKTVLLSLEFPGSDMILAAFPLMKPLGVRRWGAYQLGGDQCGIGGLTFFQEVNYDSVPVLVVRRAHLLTEDLTPPELGKLSVGISPKADTQDGCASDVPCDPLQGIHRVDFRLYLSNKDLAVEVSLDSPGNEAAQIVDPNDQPTIQVFNVRTFVAAAECLQHSEWALLKL